MCVSVCVCSGNPQLRYSLALCNEEKQFVDTRRRKIFDAMKDILGMNGPRNLREVCPRVALLRVHSLQHSNLPL